MDDIDLTTDGLVVAAGDARKFGGNAQGAARVIAKILHCGDCHAAFSNVEVEQLIDVRLVLKENILAGNADVGGAALDVDGDVRGLDPEVTDTGFGVFKNQLSVGPLDGGAGEARRLEHRVDLFSESPLGESNVKHWLQALLPRFRQTDIRRGICRPWGVCDRRQHCVRLPPA